MQFDIFANPVPAARRDYPLVVALQSPMLAESGHHVVAPLAPRRHILATGNRLLPMVRIDDDEYVVFIPRLTTLPPQALGRRVANLNRYRDSLLGALDLLFYGV